MSRKDKVPTDGRQPSLSHNPFSGLSGTGLPQGNPITAPQARSAAAKVPERNRGRVEVRRETAGRGGKTVTTVSGFVGIGLPEKEALAKQAQKVCGTGGTVKDGRIEIQGDHREKVATILTKAGFRPVFSGG